MKYISMAVFMGLVITGFLAITSITAQAAKPTSAAPIQTGFTSATGPTSIPNESGPQAGCKWAKLKAARDEKNTVATRVKGPSADQQKIVATDAVPTSH